MINNISPSLAAILERELNRGERILWQSQPRPMDNVVSKIQTFLFGIPFFAFAVVWETAVFGGIKSMQGHSQQMTNFSWFMPLWGSMFVIVGASLILSPLRNWWVARRTLYAVTDQRALIIESTWRLSIRSILADQLGSITRKEGRTGRGNLIFFRTERRGRRHSSVNDDVGFIGIEDAKGVEMLLRSVAGKVSNT